MMSSSSLLKILVRCREEVEDGLRIRVPYVLISIRDPDKPKVKVRKNRLCRAVLSLAFHDAEPSPKMKLPADIRLMSPEDGDAIRRFVDEHRGHVSAIIVHCEQGASRSPAVAAAIAGAVGADPRRFFRDYQPNRFVQSLVSRSFGETINEATTDKKLTCSPRATKSQKTPRPMRCRLGRG